MTDPATPPPYVDDLTCSEVYAETTQTLFGAPGMLRIEPQTATFAKLWEKFAAHELASPELRPSTVVDYKALGRLHLVPHLGTRLLGEIDAETIMDMKGTLQAAAGSKAAGKEGSGKALSPRSVAKILTLGGTVWRYGRRIKLVDGNPFADVKKPRAAKRQPYILDVEEIGRLRAALSVPVERLLVELTITTGMRSGEIRGLAWESIDLEGKRLFIERPASRRGEEAATKTESSVRPIPLPAYLIPELKRWKLACPLMERGLVFPGEPNARGERGPIDADILLRHVLRIAELAGLSDLGNKRETNDSVDPEEAELSDCLDGSPGWNRTNDQRINSPTLYR
jgi:integrase